MSRQTGLGGFDRWRRVESQKKRKLSRLGLGRVVESQKKRKLMSRQTGLGGSIDGEELSRRRRGS
jgi:hypothetical protein